MWPPARVVSLATSVRYCQRAPTPRRGASSGTLNLLNCLERRTAPRGVLRAAMALAILALLAAGVPPALAQEATVCQTPNGPRTTTQIADEVRAAGYAVRDTASAAAAYARASGGPVTCAKPATTRPLAVVLLAGYGSDLTSAELVFAPLQAALAARSPNIAIVTYSYTGRPSVAATRRHPRTIRRIRRRTSRSANGSCATRWRRSSKLRCGSDRYRRSQPGRTHRPPGTRRAVRASRERPRHRR